MSYQDHLRVCPDCQRRQRPTIRIKSASSRRRESKLAELGALIRGIEYPEISFVKRASSNEKSQKLKELGKLVRG